MNSSATFSDPSGSHAVVVRRLQNVSAPAKASSIGRQGEGRWVALGATSCLLFAFALAFDWIDAGSIGMQLDAIMDRVAHFLISLGDPRFWGYPTAT